MKFLGGLIVVVIKHNISFLSHLPPYFKNHKFQTLTLVTILLELLMNNPAIIFPHGSLIQTYIPNNMPILMIMLRDINIHKDTLKILTCEDLMSDLGEILKTVLMIPPTLMDMICMIEIDKILPITILY